MRWLAFIAITLGVTYLGFKAFYPDYTYRYRLELTLEVDGKPYTGSSVIEVKWIGGPAVSAHGAYAADGRLRGQAPVIDLGDRGVVVAALINGGSANLDNYRAVDALWLCALAFGSDSSYADLPKLEKLTGRREIPPDDWPLLIYFPNPSDPMSARKFNPAQVQDVFGAAARFASAFVQITNDPVVVEIDKRLPWYSAWAKDYRQKGPIWVTNRFALIRDMFVGDAS
jgi:hypothetical protein